MASSPARSISVQARMFLAAVKRWLSCLAPMWWVSAPQQPAPLATTTSQPNRVSSRMVASLMSVFSAFCAQPVIRATRIVFSPLAGKTCGVVVAADRRDALWGHVQHGAEAGVGDETAERPGDFRAKERKAEAARIGQDHREGVAKDAFEKRSLVGLSIWARAWSTRCM